MNKNAKIFLPGHTGLVGSAILRMLKERVYTNILTRQSKELDLRRQGDVEAFFEAERPEYVFLAAARVGGIMANATYSAEFIYDNILISSNVIHTAYKYGVQKLINFGSSCIYPKLVSQPIKEEYLLTGPLEATNEAYAIAKIAALKLCRYYNEQYGTNFISLMPTNLYGPGDNFDLNNSHVLPALIRKIFEAKKQDRDVTLWGDGSPMREFLYVDDLTEAVLFLMENYNASDTGEVINIGTGKDISIADLAVKIGKIVGFTGNINWDTSKPNGTPRKVLDVKRINKLGWKAETSLTDGLEKTYRWYYNSLHSNVNF